MMTVREAMQRVRENRARIRRDVATQEWVVTLYEHDNAPDGGYRTDDLEDAVLMSGTMRRASR